MTIDILKTMPAVDQKCVSVKVQPQKLPVRRSLFGAVNHDESMEFLRKQMQEIAEEQKKKYDFDFDKEEPLASCEYEWTKIEGNEMIPQCYALQRLTYLFENTDNTIGEPETIESQQPQVTIKLRQTLLDGYVKSRKRSSTNETRPSKFDTSDFEPTNKKICFTPGKAEN